jgi:uncharacterized protein (DUF1800 family)
MEATPQQIAHILRRTTFGPFPGQVEGYAGRSVDEVITSLLAAGEQPITPPDVSPANQRRFDDLIHWWPRTMRTDQAGLHEKMTFFWHALIPSSIEKCELSTVFEQHLLLRRHALGNVRTLLHEITLDRAMLQYLDALGSFSSMPNENYARELMELFALGRDNGYTETDVRNGARALAGYSLDWDNGMTLQFNPVSALGAPVPFLGTSVMNASDVVDAVIDHPNCAPYVASRVHAFFCGGAPSPERQAELGTILLEANMEIRPVVESVLRHPSFMDSARNRARTPVEWVCATARILNVDIDSWPLAEMGMRPLSPPNVAGWPPELDWFSAGAAFAWVTTSYDRLWASGVPDGPDLVDRVAVRAGIYDLSDTTRAAVQGTLDTLANPEERVAMAHALMVTSPEFVTA